MKDEGLLSLEAVKAEVVQSQNCISVGNPP